MRGTKRLAGLILVTGLIVTGLLVGCAQPAPTPTVAPPKAAASPTAASGSSAPTPSGTQAPAKTQPTNTPAPSKPASQAPLVPIKIGHLTNLSDTPNYLAFEKGYFKEQGIDAQFEMFRSGADMVAPLVTGDLQVGRGAISVGLFNAFGRAADIISVANASRSIPGFSGGTWMVRPDLKDQLKTFKDLKGRRINLSGVGSIVTYALGTALEKEGLTLNDVDIVYLGHADVAPALANKAVDVTYATEPNISQFIQNNLAVLWLKAYPNEPVELGTLMFSSKWMQRQPEISKGFAVAYLKGARDFVRAMKGGPNRKEVVQVAAKYTTLKDTSLYDKMEWTYIGPDGYIDVAGLQKIHDWFLKNKMLEKPVNLKTVLDSTYMDHANQVLGKWTE